MCQSTQALSLVYAADMDAQDHLNSGTPENEEKLRELAAALRSEFESANDSTTRQTALKDLEDLKPDFLKTLRYTVNHSQSDSLRAKVAMWGYEKLLEESKASKDPLADLLAAIPVAPTPDNTIDLSDPD